MGSEASRYKSSRIRNQNLKYRYGITLRERDELLYKQGNKCCICGINLKDDTSHRDRIYVDHDHITGKLCGILCCNCNTGLGVFGENCLTLAKALKYLYNRKKTPKFTVDRYGNKIYTIKTDSDMVRHYNVIRNPDKPDEFDLLFVKGWKKKKKQLLPNSLEEFL